MIYTPGIPVVQPAFTVTEPGHLKIVGNWVRGDLVVGNASTPGLSAVVGMVTQVISTSEYVLITEGFFASTSIPGADGDVLYLQNNGTIGTTPGTYEKAVGINVPGGMVVNTAILGTGYVPVQNNLAATRAPLATDDSSDGYSATSKWYWDASPTPEVWVCVDASINNAVWLLTTLTLDDLGSMATQDSDNVAITGGTAALTSVTIGPDNTDGSYRFSIVSGSMVVEKKVSGAWTTYMTLAIPIPLTYTGSDTPGTGDNIIADGASRVWYDTATGLTYNMTRVGSNYKLVEMT